MTNVAFAEVPAEAALDPKMRADLLETWVAAIDAGGSVGFTPPTPVDQVAAALDFGLDRVAAGLDAMGILRTDGRAVGWTPRRHPRRPGRRPRRGDDGRPPRRLKLRR